MTSPRLSSRPSTPPRPAGPSGPAGPTRPGRPVRVLAVALAVGTLLATAACSDDGDDSASTDSSTATSSAGQRTATASPSITPLTSAGAQTALITAGDLEDNWTQVKTAAGWRNRMLIGTVDAAQFLTGKTQAADCQRLLDGLYDEDLLGPPPGPSALTGFTEGNSRLLYQVAAYQPASLDQSFDWLKTLPTACDQFNAVGSDGSTRTVQVVEASLPKSGDDRQGLTVTVAGPPAAPRSPSPWTSPSYGSGKTRSRSPTAERTERTTTAPRTRSATARHDSRTYGKAAHRRRSPASSTERVGSAGRRPGCSGLLPRLCTM